MVAVPHRVIIIIITKIETDRWLVSGFIVEAENAPVAVVYSKRLDAGCVLRGSRREDASHALIGADTVAVARSKRVPSLERAQEPTMAASTPAGGWRRRGLGPSTHLQHPVQEDHAAYRAAAPPSAHKGRLLLAPVRPRAPLLLDPLHSPLGGQPEQKGEQRELVAGKRGCSQR